MHPKAGLSPPLLPSSYYSRPKALLSLRFHLFYVRYCLFLNFLILTILCVLLFYLVRSIGLPTVLERAADSAYHLLFRCLLRYVCSSFPSMFRTNFGF